MRPRLAREGEHALHAHRRQLPYCKNRKLLRGFNDLVTVHPELAAEWDFGRNGDLRPDGVRFNSTKQVWWRGGCGHEWQMSPRQRAAEGLGCPYCSGHRVLADFNDLASQHPELLAEWDWGLNGDLRPDGIVSGSARRVWWRCGHGHAWRISAYNRTGGADRGCPYCGDRKVLKGYNDLRTTHPKIAREWNKERNGDLKPTDVIASSNKRVWWKCEEGHEWSGLIANRARKGKADPGCPYCSGRKVLAGFNDLATTHPDIAAMWHPRMNKRLKPTGVQAVSRKLAWWRASAATSTRWPSATGWGTSRAAAPYCSGRPERPIDSTSPRPSARKERGRRRCLLPIGVILRILGWMVMRSSYGGPHRFRWLLGLRAHGDVRFRRRRGDAEHAGASAECGDTNTLAELWRFRCACCHP